LRRVPYLFQREGWQAGRQTAELDETHLDAATIGSVGRGIQRVLQARFARLERADEDLVVPGGRAHRISGAALRSLTAAVRYVLPNGEVGPSPLRSTRADHGTLRRTRSGVFALCPRCCRFVGPAVECVAPAVAGRPAYRADPEM